jgi:hypothetical protein
MSDKQTKRMGRPPVAVDPAQLEKLAARWLTKEAAADILGISRRTLFDKLKDDPALEAAWLRGRSMLQANTMDWLINSAQSGSVRAQMFLAERVVGLDGKSKDSESVTETAREIRNALKAMVETELPPDDGSTL